MDGFCIISQISEGFIGSFVYLGRLGSAGLVRLYLVLVLSISMHQLAELRKSVHLPAVASKLYGYMLHLHLICGSKSHARISGSMEILLS